MNISTLVKILKNQHRFEIALLIISELVVKLFANEAEQILGCFSLRSEKNTVLNLILENIEFTDKKEIFKLIEPLDNQLSIIIKIIKNQQFSFEYEDIKKYLKESNKQDLIDLLSLNYFNYYLFDIFDELKGSYNIDDETRLVIITKINNLDYYKNNYNIPEKLSEYFANYDYYSKACKHFSCTENDYEKYHDKILEDNRTLVIFGTPYHLDEMVQNDEYIFNSKTDDVISEFKLKRTGYDSLQMNISRNFKAGFSNSFLTVRVSRGLIIDVNGLYQCMK